MLPINQLGSSHVLSQLGTMPYDFRVLETSALPQFLDPHAGFRTYTCW